MQVKGLTAVVTGGATGLGKATVKAFLEAGANVAILDVNDEAGHKLAQHYGQKAIFQHADVTDEKSIDAALDTAQKIFGCVNVVVNSGCPSLNAANDEDEGFKKASSRYHQILQTNLMGTFNILQAAAKKMKCNQRNASGESGVIINTACVAESEGKVGQDACRASKDAVARMGIPLAKEFDAYGIRVNTIEPATGDSIRFGLNGMAEIIPASKRTTSPTEFAEKALSVVEDSCMNAKTISLN
ncbi:SDR family NAD(P)-dependent oxidoreductase [Endozoicomonas arenosclerae]|uniref:SDR family NAD(P)-dependent oxidoreductase n=1 Tax=Endozoicomonas arenosclerae TaxID=1633495 RepID=UPI0007852B92|nr:SDR family NAD(P)-dependent oxidoreductase [Endozoicomonas arenosclerae]